MASFNFFESSAILIDLSCLTVITTGLLKYSSKHLSYFIICLSSISFWSSFSTLSIRWSGTLLLLCCVGWNVWWNVDFATWFLNFPILVHMCGFFGIPILQCYFILIIYCIFSPGLVSAR